MQTLQPTPGTKKVRRDSIGGKRGDGNLRTCRIHRPDPRKIHLGRPDQGLTGYGGLVQFGSFVRDLGIPAALHELFFRLKSGAMVIYPMEAQIELLIDAAAAGEQRVFGIEALSADPIFSYMAGGVVPSIDTIYRDLRRFDEQAIVDLEALMAKHGLVAPCTS